MSARPRSQFVELLTTEIVIDEKWHGRSAAGSGGAIDDAEAPGQEWSGAQLLDSIRRHGLIEPLRVRKLDDGRWALVAGSRRLACCVIIDSEGEPQRWPCTFDERERDDFIAASATLAENTHRRPMRNYEIANFLWRMHAARPEMSPAELAEACSMSRSFCSQLLLVRSRATKEMWQLFERHDGKLPAGVSWRAYVGVCKLPPVKQMPAWLALVDERLGGPSKEQRPKRGTYRPSVAQLKRWAALASGGLQLGLRAAAGDARALAKVKQKLQPGD